MIALIMNSGGESLPVVLSATTVDAAIEEIDLHHRALLYRSGFTPEMLQGRTLSDLHWLPYDWESTVYIDTFLSPWTGDESDDIPLTVCLHDPGRAVATHTGMFVGGSCETIIFEYDEVDADSLREHAYDALLHDCDDLKENLHSCFPPAWIECNRGRMPETIELLPGLRFCMLQGNGLLEEWSLLRLYIFDNRPPACSFH